MAISAHLVQPHASCERFTPKSRSESNSLWNVVTCPPRSLKLHQAGARGGYKVAIPIACCACCLNAECLRSKTEQRMR